MANETIPDLTAGTPPFAAGTLVELAVPDGLGGFVSRKGPLANVVGMTPLASGTITDPVAYFDLALPAGYSIFKLQMFNVQLSVRDYLAGAFSYDNGATFWSDANFNSYLNAESSQYASTIADIFAGSGNTDALMTLGDRSFKASDANLKLGQMIDATIYQGTNATFPLVSSLSWGIVNADAFLLTNNLNSIFPASTVPAQLGPVNLIRVLPYGNGNCDPPTSGETITGSYFLSGVPTP